MEELSVHRQLNELRRRLRKLINEERMRLTDPPVVAVSQQMDALVLYLQMEQMRRTGVCTAEYGEKEKAV